MPSKRIWPLRAFTLFPSSHPHLCTLSLFIYAFFLPVIYCIFSHIIINNDIIINLFFKPKNSLRTKFAFPGITWPEAFYAQYIRTMHNVGKTRCAAQTGGPWSYALEHRALVRLDQQLQPRWKCLHTGNRLKRKTVVGITVNLPDPSMPHPHAVSIQSGQWAPALGWVLVSLCQSR